MSHPQKVLAFIERQPSLTEVCQCMPEVLLEFAPQLAIPGFGGKLEDTIEVWYQQSVAEWKERRQKNDRSGGLTTNGVSPLCEKCFALRHPTFGDYEPASVANGYVIGHGAGLGPHTQACPIFDYLIWFLSSDSNWLPRKHHACLLQGMKDWAQWLWYGREADSGYDGPEAGAFFDWLLTAKSSGDSDLPANAKIDLVNRIEFSKRSLGLQDEIQTLVDRFCAEQIIESWLNRDENRSARRKRRESPRRVRH